MVLLAAQINKEGAAIHPIPRAPPPQAPQAQALLLARDTCDLGELVFDPAECLRSHNMAHDRLLTNGRLLAVKPAWQAEAKLSGGQACLAGCWRSSLPGKRKRS